MLTKTALKAKITLLSQLNYQAQIEVVVSSSISGGSIMWTKCKSQLSELLALAKGQSLTERVDRNSKNKVVIKFPEELLHNQE